MSNALRLADRHVEPTLLVHQRPSRITLAMRTMTIGFGLVLLVSGCGGSGGSGGGGDSDMDTISRVDRQRNGSGGIGTANAIRLGYDGRWAVFTSNAGDLVADDPTGLQDVFLKDRSTGQLRLISRAWNAIGRPVGNGTSSSPALSTEGEFVAFASEAGNLVADDDNGVSDIFVVDVLASTIERVSVNSDGTEANGASTACDLSQEGRYIVFQSAATNLVAGDSNASIDVFRHDRSTGITIRVSTTSDGDQKTGDSTAPSMNGAGYLVAFSSMAALVDGDVNTTATDVFVRDMTASTTTLASPQGAGTTHGADRPSGEACMAGDGAFLVYSSTRLDLIQFQDTAQGSSVFRYNVNSGELEIVSRAASGGPFITANAFAPRISGDGSLVVFHSADSRLVENDYGQQDVFLCEVDAQVTTRLSVNEHATPNNGPSGSADISRDGSTVGFLATGSVLPGGSDQQHAYAMPVVPTGGG